VRYVLIASSEELPEGYTELSDNEMISVDRDLRVSKHAL
jgi:hypothetical protein